MGVLTTAPSTQFRPALIIVDLQEDFCPPNGSLAIPNGRDILPSIETLLSLSFPLKVATRDWHPPNHISFCTSHSPSSPRLVPPLTPPSPKTTHPHPFTSFVTMANPKNQSETLVTRLWPPHCRQNTAGAALISEFQSLMEKHPLSFVVDKGTDTDVETYSAFYAPFRDPSRIADTGLAARLHQEGVTHVYIAGLAADYCVGETACDAVAEGFVTYIVQEATRAVDPENWPQAAKELESDGVHIISLQDEQIKRVQQLS